MEYKLIPSDLTFLYDNCKHCFVMKVKHGISQPSIPIPGIFSIIASLQKEYYSGKRTEDFCPELPLGKITHGEKWVRSNIIEIPDCENNCYINGRFDIVAELDDGSYAILDFKTGNPSDEKTLLYSRQLQSYALALENPAPGALHLAPISTLGLLYFTPDKCDQLDIMRQNLEGKLTWINVEKDDSEFLNFLKEIVTLLDGPFPAPEPENCEWCSYTQRTNSIIRKDSGMTSSSQIKVPTCPQCNGPMQMKTGKYGDFWSCLKFPECKGTRKVA